MLTKKIAGYGGLATALVLLVGINTISSTSLKSARLDLTENKLYTLTQGSKNIVRDLKDPVTLRFYFSEKLSNRYPQLKSYGTRVQELLEEYVAASGGNLKLEIIDPIPFSEEEDKAVQAGMQGAPITRAETFYFGLEALDSTDLQKTIPFFNQEREEFLEYDISQLIFNVATTKKSRIAILSGLPVDGEAQDPMARMMGQQGGKEPWVIVQQLRQLFDVQVLDFKAESLPADMDALMIIHPKEVPAKLLYEIDQYALRGGKIAVFVDPHAEVETPPASPNNQFQSMMAPRSSEMPELFTAWGIELVKDQVVADRARAIEVPAGSQTRPKITPFVVYLALTKDDLNQNEQVTNQLDRLQIGMPGQLRKLDGGKTEVVPVIESSEDSMTIAADKVRFYPNPEELLKEFVPDGKKKIIAARVTGNVSSAYPEGPAEGEKRADHLTESKEPLNVFVYTDVDMLTDRMWVQTQRFLGQTMLIPTAQNGNLVQNTMDLLSGSKDLIGIRSRGRSQRPFDLVESMQKEAEKKYAERVKVLEGSLKETEEKLAELQKSRQDGSSAMFLTDEQRSEIEKFTEQRISTRKELRNLELALRQDIEKLGTKLKLINIGLMPLLVGVVAVGMGIFRINRRRRR